MPCLTPPLQLNLIELHCLQFGVDGDQLNPWRQMDGITDWTSNLGDFSDTAHVVSQLDLVICIDTAVAHLAGALNDPRGCCCHTTPISVGSVIEMIHLGTLLCDSSGRLLAMIGHQLLSNSIQLSTSCFSSMWLPLLMPKV